MAKRKQKKSRTYQGQAWGALLLAVSILLFFSIATFDINDPVHLDTNGHQIKINNWLGPFGAMISYYLMQWTLGYPVIIFPILMAVFAIFAIQRKKNEILLKPSISISIWAVMISIFLAMPEAIDKAGVISEYYPSGLIGGWLAAKLVIYLGNIGSLLTLVLVTFVLAVVTIRLQLETFFNRLTQMISIIIGFILEKLSYLFSAIKGKWTEYRINRARKIAGKKQKTVNEPIADIQIDEEQDIQKATTLAQNNTTADFDESSIEKESVISENELETQKPFIKTTLEELVNGIDQKDNDIESPKPVIRNSPTEPIEFEYREEVKNEEIDYDQLVKESVAKYQFPSIDFLQSRVGQETSVTREELKSNAELLELKLLDFGVKAKVVRVSAGPVITLYELQPAPGVKVSSIVNLANDLALAMEARGIRIIAPIPGKAAVGIEIPNRYPQTVYLKQLIRSEKFNMSEHQLPLALGKTINGEAYIADLTKMPHLLIAGATGSGKSVGINTIIMSMLYSVDPGNVKFMMIDPKKLELSIYRDLKDHYLIWRPDLDEEVVTKPNNAVSMLNSIVLEMEKRYNELAALKVRSIVEFNSKLTNLNYQYGGVKYQLLPFIVVIIDELADLMMVAAKEVEAPIARLAQMARAVGIHLIVATQRPSVDVITGMIKANFPARIAYQVATKVDSRTVIDMNGAEQLLGNGDMLFLPPGYPKPIRLQNPFISTEEVETIIKHISSQSKLPHYSIPQPKRRGSGISGDFESISDHDPLYEEARAIVVQHQQGSISFLQRRLKIGYSRAARLMDELEEQGIVGAADGSKPREVLITLQELQQL